MNKMTLGQRIRIARVTANLSQHELGAKLEPPRTHSAISYIEKGKSNLYVPDLIQIATITQRPLTYFFNGDELVVDAV